MLRRSAVAGARCWSRSGALSAAAVGSQRRSLHYEARLRDIEFTMYDVLKYNEHYRREGFAEADRETVMALLGECGRFCEQELAPLYEGGDKEGCSLDADTNQVSTPSGWKEAYQSYIEAGWQGLSVPEKYGGQGLPGSLGLLKAEMIATANWSWGMYPGLSIGAMNTLLLHGTEEMKQTYVTKMASGEWTGTMLLTESQCGTDLGQVKTKATPAGDGKYKLNGEKIFISCGEHEWGDNIVHIALARLPDAPAGTKGISLFLVPKFLPDADGNIDKDAPQNIKCVGLENKMGIHGSSTCVMSLNDSVGFMIGEPNTGLHQMFTFMNTARIGTAVQGVGSAEIAYLNSVPYAKERMSMRALSGAKQPDRPADYIIEHPDVRRMLLFQRAVAEGGRAMIYDACKLMDRWLIAKDPKEAKRLDSELGLYTPILKGFLTELGCEAASHGMQVYGGHGYIKDYPMEQIYRDARISTLYEGTTGVQALDLLGRKVLLNRGKHLAKFSTRILGSCKEVFLNSKQRSRLSGMAWKTTKQVLQWNRLTYLLMARAAQDRDVVGAAATDYLMYSGYSTMAYYWLEMAKAAVVKQRGATPEEKQFYETKIATAEFFFEYMLPRTKAHAVAMNVPISALLKMKTEDF